jgi:hypothetical protein
MTDQKAQEGTRTIQGNLNVPEGGGIKGASTSPQQPVLLGCRRELVAQAVTEDHSVGTPSGCIRSGVKSESNVGTFSSRAICTQRFNERASSPA